MLLLPVEEPIYLPDPSLQEKVPNILQTVPSSREEGAPMQGGMELRGLANHGTSARSVAAGSLVDTASYRVHLPPWE